MASEATITVMRVILVLIAISAYLMPFREDPKVTEWHRITYHVLAVVILITAALFGRLA